MASGKILSLKEREEIERLLNLGFGIVKIAKALSRSKGAISTEVLRNGGREKYNAKQANDNSFKRKNVYIKKINDLDCRINNIEMQLDIIIDELMKLKNNTKK